MLFLYQYTLYILQKISSSSFNITITLNVQYGAYLASWIELYSMVWIADRECFPIRYFVGSEKNAAMRETATPLCCDGNHEQMFRHSSEYIDARVSLFAYPPPPSQHPSLILVLVRGTIRDTHPEGKCLCPCVGISVMSVNAGGFDIKECARLRRRCRLSAHHLQREDPPFPFGHVFAKSYNLHTLYIPYIFASETRECLSKTRFQNNARTPGGDIFLSGDRGALSIRCKRGVKTLVRERGGIGGGRGERERASSMLSTVIIEDGVVDLLSSCSL